MSNNNLKNFFSLNSDFEYNEKLIFERDEDLKVFDTIIERFLDLIKEKEKKITELEENTLISNNKLIAIKGKLDTVEETYKYKMNQLILNHKEDIK